MEQWYTLHTKPNSEYQVALALQQGEIETYLPEIELAQVYRERKKRKPFFPCYLFIRADLEVVNFARWQWTPGLLRIVAFDSQPVPLPDAVIDQIRRKLAELNAANGRPASAFRPGDTVRINEGPFQDMLAIFDGPSTPKGRVQVLMAVLGQVSRVRMDEANLEKVSLHVEAPRAKRPRGTRGRSRYIR